MRNFLLYFFRRNKLINFFHRNLPFNYHNQFESTSELIEINKSKLISTEIEVVQKLIMGIEKHEYVIPSQKIYQLKNVKIFSENGALMDQSKNLYLNSFKGKDIAAYNFYYNLDFFSASKKIIEKSTFLFAPSNYWHFHVEYIAKILLLTEQFMNVKIYSNELIYSWQEQALEFYKIPKEKIKFINNATKYINFKDFIFLDFFGTDYLGFNCVSSSILLQNSIHNNFKTNVHLSNKRIYITRKHAVNRKLLNENDLIDLLLVYSFEIVILEELTIENQYLLFANSEIIIAQHGASLTNMLSTKNSKIIELFNPEWPMNMYAVMAEATKNKLFRINISEFRGNDPQSADYILDIDDLKFLLTKLGLQKTILN